MPGKPLQAWSARMPGWRIRLSAAAALNAVAAMAAMPPVALARTPGAEPECRRAAPDATLTEIDPATGEELLSV